MLDAAPCKDSTPQKPRGVLLGNIARAHGAALRQGYALTPEQQAIEADQVKVCAEHDAPMRRALFETKWNVYEKAPFGGAEQVYSYLGRYTHRVGISNARILRADDQRVEFATKNGRTCSLAPVAFSCWTHSEGRQHLDSGEQRGRQSATLTGL